MSGPLEHREGDAETSRVRQNLSTLATVSAKKWSDDPACPTCLQKVHQALHILRIYIDAPAPTPDEPIRQKLETSAHPSKQDRAMDSRPEC